MLDLVHTDIYENDELKHWGIIGMKWGIRRYQNPDGTLTPEGKIHYSKELSKIIKKENDNQKIYSKAVDSFNEKLYEINNKPHEYYGEKYYKELDDIWKDIYGDLLKEKYGDIAGKIYKDEKEWLEQFDEWHIFDETIEYYHKLGK